MMVLWQLVASWGLGRRVCKVRGEKSEENAEHLHSLSTTLAPNHDDTCSHTVRYYNLTGGIAMSIHLQTAIKLLGALVCVLLKHFRPPEKPFCQCLYTHSTCPPYHTKCLHCNSGQDAVIDLKVNCPYIQCHPLMTGSIGSFPLPTLYISSITTSKSPSFQSLVASHSFSNTISNPSLVFSLSGRNVASE